MKRVILAGLAGAVAMFLWSSVAHMATPLASTGVEEIPNETAVVTAMQSNIGSHGLYLFPGYGLGHKPSMAEMRANMESQQKKLATSPSGLLVYFPPNRPMNFGALMAVEFGNELLLSLIAMSLLAMAGISGYGRRVLFVAVLGTAAVLTTNVSYWNWYGFPSNYTCAYMFTEWMGFLAAGLAGAAVLGRDRAMAHAA